jgi:Kef-type K+ transport system membrane component KefB
MNRTSIFYVCLLTAVSLSIWGVLHLGSGLPAPTGLADNVSIANPVLPAAGDDSLLGGLRKNLDSPLSHLFLQLVVIIAASRGMGRLFGRLGQPPVVGEMAMGVLLGPSLFGWLAPDVFAFVFPAASLDTLKLLSQIGVCLFMFTVGMELNVGLVRQKASTAILVSHASIVIPFLLGTSLAWFLYTHLAAPGATFTAFALFLGISMSITAFPVLARVLQDRGLSRTTLGATAITCAAVDDVTAWTLLAFVVAIVQSASLAGSVFNLLLVLVFVAVMVWGVKKVLPIALGKSLEDEHPSRGALALVTLVVVASALCTEAIGIHALFGAFLAGTIMPETQGFRHKLTVRLENFSSVLLLPLFFVFTGLRTEVGLLAGADDWLLCLLIIAVATAGKLGGSALTARFSGMPWHESLQLGALMNTRGLMELIALNIGYDMGILSARIFTMLVIMALVTTMLTGPLLTLFSRTATLASVPEPARS